MQSTGILVVLLLFHSLHTSSGQSRTIKLVDGVESTTFIGGLNMLNDLPAVHPDDFRGPDALRVLDGQCFNITQERYVYTLCPFQNITQTRSIGQKPTLLGAWGYWSNERTMTYIKGDACGPDFHRTTTVEISCNDILDFRIIFVDESMPCQYKMRMGLPIACSLLAFDPVDAKSFGVMGPTSITNNEEIKDQETTGQKVNAPAEDAVMRTDNITTTHSPEDYFSAPTQIELPESGRVNEAAIAGDVLIPQQERRETASITAFRIKVDSMQQTLVSLTAELSNLSELAAVLERGQVQ